MPIRVGKHMEAEAPAPGRATDPAPGSQPTGGPVEDGYAWALPRRIGRYLLGEPLGQGGMGKVYAAYDLVLKREVALKLLWRNDPVLLVRFLQEAQFQARLDHPNICKVYEVEATGGTPFIAMQLVHGQGLLDVERHLETDALLDLMIQCAEAVQAAHGAGMIHRDLKPGNILLEEDGKGGWKPVLLDFGLAKDLTADFTQGSRVLGTPAYMAPEQALGLGASVRSDIYSLGATFHAFLTGAPPFPAGPAGASARRSRVRPPTQHPSGVPPGLDLILQTCLRYHPFERYASALALAEDLRRLRCGAPLHARRPARILGLARAALIAAALGSLGGGAWFALRPPPPPLAGLRAGPERPLRMLLVAGNPIKPSESWIGAGLREALTGALRGRRDLLIYGPPLTGSSSQGPTDAGAVKELAARHGADLVLLMSFRSEGDHHRLRLETLRTGERLAHPLLDKSFDTQDYLAVEAELHRLLPARLGLSGPARPWTGPRFLETRRTTVQASQLVTAELNSEGLGAALALLRKITAQEPDYALPHALLGVVLASEANEASHRGDTAKATADLAEGTREALTAVRLGPADPEGYNALCLNLRVAGDPGGTERAARQYLAIEPLAIRPHLYLARIEAARPTAEAFQSAVAHLRSAVLLGPEDPEASYRLGQIHLDAGQWALALPALDQAINAMPQMEFAHVVKSNALIWSGRTQEAEASLKAAQRWVPNSILIKRNLAYTAYLLGDLSAFTERLARCRELWPKGNATREFLDGLEEASRGHWRQAQARYGAQLRHFRDHQATLSQSLGTSISVDLYLMGRVLAQGPDRAAAKPYVQLADHYAPNRLRMARRDPAFKGLWPEPEPWPGD